MRSRITRGPHLTAPSNYCPVLSLVDLQQRQLDAASDDIAAERRCPRVELFLACRGEQERLPRRYVGSELWAGRAVRRLARIGSYGRPRSAIAMSGLAIGLDDRKPFNAQ
jgi:hypothetical protein